MAAIIEPEIQIVKRFPMISWGAVFAGLFFVITASWLLFLLGSAIGVGVADATDMEAMGQGFGIGAAIWLLVTTVIVYFLGGWLAARLDGNPDKGNGLLHGLVVWSAVGVLILLLGSWGVSNIMQTGQALLGGAARTIAQGADAAGGAAAESQAADSQLLSEIGEMIRQRAVELTAQAGAAAAEEAPGGQAPSRQELEQAIRSMDTQTLTQVARELIAGNTQGARSALAANTNLSEQQINTLLQGLSQTVNERVGQARQRISETAEKASTYTQGVIWTLFFSSLLGLGGALFGGAIGARKTPRD
jgi:hypothetical protein